MKRNRRRLLLAIFLVIPIALVGAVLLYLNFADLSGWRDTVERLASDAIGRELRIDGEFQPEVGFTTRVVATDVTLANSPWSDESQMVSVEHLDAAIDLLSIFSGPITIRDVKISGARVLFEVGNDGSFNWALGDGKPPETEEAHDSQVELVITDAALDDIHLVYRSGPGRDLEADLSKLEFTDDGTGMLDLGLAGSLSGYPIELSGRLGTFIGLINANRVEHDLTGRFADAEFGLQGTIEDLGSLTGVEGDVSARGLEISQITDSFGLDPIIEGPFTVKASVKPSASGSDIDLDATAGAGNARIIGAVDSLTRPKIFDATVTASGPSIRAIGAFTGVENLPDEEFSVSGGVRWEGFPVTFKEFEVSVGENTLSADGVLGAPPRMLGTDFTIRGEGPNASSIGALAGIDLPDDSFAVSGRVLRVEDGLEVEQVEANVGRTILRVEGRVGDPPDYDGTTLTLHAEGPSMAQFKNLLGKELPAGPFAIDGRLVRGNEAIALEGVSARFGRTTLQLDGYLKTAKGLSGTKLRLRAKGPDATQIAWLAGVNDVPHEAWTLEGGVTILESGFDLDGVSATVGSLEAHGDGYLSATKGLVGTDLRLHGEDSDLSHAMSIFGVDGFPGVAAVADGRLRLEAAGIRLDGATGSVGDIDVAVDGVISTASGLDGTQGHVSVHGPRLASLGPYFRLEGLPEAPFSVSGDVQVTRERVDLDNVVSEVDSNRLEIRGTVVPVKGLVGTDLHIDLSAPDLGRAGTLAAGLYELPNLPSEAFTLATRLSIDEAGYEIDGMRVSLDRAEAKVNGRVSAASDLVGTNLRVEADGPKASLFSAFTGVDVPVAPFKVSGRVERTEDFFIFDHVVLRLGGHAVNIHGSLGEKPHRIGTDLDLYASGPGTGLIAELTGFDKLPDEPFEIGGTFHGTPEKFSTEGLEITLGESDLKGTLEVDIQGKPKFMVHISSNRLDLAPYLAKDPTQESDGVEDGDASADPAKRRVISNNPIDFGLLQKADVDLSLTVGTLQLPVKVFRNVDFGARLADGRLEVHRFSMVGQREGSGNSTLILEPVGDAYRLETVWDLNAIRLDLPGSDVADPMSQPPIDLDLHLSAQGRSAHDFARSSNGSFQLIFGKGVMDNKVLDFVTADVLVTLLKAFNPFAREEEVTELQCGVALLTFENGLATLEPMALQSDKMTMLGKGKLNLDTEKLDFDWITKPRKGIGLSTSMLTNPYIKVGGTLGKPTIELKGIEAVTQTGVAVATMGLSLVAKGMLDRVTAEKKVCKKALEEVEKMRQGE